MLVEKWPILAGEEFVQSWLRCKESRGRHKSRTAQFSVLEKKKKQPGSVLATIMGAKIEGSTSSNRRFLNLCIAKMALPILAMPRFRKRSLLEALPNYVDILK